MIEHLKEMVDHENRGTERKCLLKKLVLDKEMHGLMDFYGSEYCVLEFMCINVLLKYKSCVEKSIAEYMIIHGRRVYRSLACQILNEVKQLVTNIVIFDRTIDAYLQDNSKKSTQHKVMLFKLM